MLSPRRKDVVKIYDEEGNCEEREVVLVLDVGAARMMKAETGRDIMSMSQATMDTEFIADILYYTAKRGKSKLTIADIDSMALGDLLAKTELITDMLMAFMPEGKSGPLPGKQKK